MFGNYLLEGNIQKVTEKSANLFSLLKSEDIGGFLQIFQITKVLTTYERP